MLTLCPSNILSSECRALNASFAMENSMPSQTGNQFRVKTLVSLAYLRLAKLAVEFCTPWICFEGTSIDCRKGL